MVEIHISVGGHLESPRPSAWTIRFESTNRLANTFVLQEKHDCYLSANTKLAGFDKMVRLSSPELAQSFINALKEVMEKRHGDLVQLTAEPYGEFGKRKNFDDAVVLARIKTNNFAPNRAPDLVTR